MGRGRPINQPGRRKGYAEIGRRRCHHCQSCAQHFGLHKGAVEDDQASLRRVDVGQRGGASRRVMQMLAGALIALLFLLPNPLSAQRGRGAPAGPPPTPQASAPIDLTGYWESYVNEDWLLRMVTPKKGDYQTLPLNAEGKKAGDTWDPDKDKAAGLQCK